MRGRPFRPVRSLTPAEARYHQLQHAIAGARRHRDGRIVGLPGGYLGVALRAHTRALGLPDGSVVPWLGVGPDPCPVCDLPVREPRTPINVQIMGGLGVAGVGPAAGAAAAMAFTATQRAVEAEAHRLVALRRRQGWR